MKGLVAFLLLPVSSFIKGSTYRWVNDKGQAHFGD
ncbi:MAG: DUF4124 domain-containing protein [Oceanospirillales bacterium]|nr:DUF4124 domain-containing protein [Oceanospirillales bacterium]